MIFTALGSGCSDRLFCDLGSERKYLLVGAPLGVAADGLTGMLLGGLKKDKKWEIIPLQSISNQVSTNEIKIHEIPGITFRWSFLKDHELRLNS